MDLVVRAPRLPSPGDTVLGADLVRVPGGKGANQAVAAARLGAPTVFIGCVGDDAFGDELRAALVADGIDVQHLHRAADRPSGVALIVVDDRGENLIAVSPGANHALTVADAESALRDLRADDVVLAQLEVPLETVAVACRAAKTVGAQVVLNAAPAHGGAVDLLRLVSTLIVNRGEAEALGGPAEVLRRHGPDAVVVTLGADGLELSAGHREWRMAAHQVEVVDTTGAGDAFCGAFATALLEGNSSDAAARFANAAAALATTRLGAQSSLPRRAEVDSVLGQGGT
jgi:ribokinase